MENSKLVEDLENGEFLNEMIESNREMDNLLLESNFLLETAESELKETIKEPSPRVISEDEDTSSALSIEVSEDLFKGYASDVKFSPIRSTLHSEHQKKQKMVVPDDLFEGHTSDLKFIALNSASHSEDQKEEQANLNVDPVYTINKEDRKEQHNSLTNLLDDFNASLKSYNEVFQLNEELNKTVRNEVDDINNDNDKTLVAEQIEDEITKSSDTNKSVQVKPVLLLNSEDEYDYLYADMYNTTLEITVPNMDENINSSPKIEKLKHQDHFEGCSQDFDSKNVGNEFTVILNTEPTATACNTEKTDAEDLVSSELSNDIVQKASEPTTPQPQYDFASDNIKSPFLNVYEIEVKNSENTIENEVTSPVNEALIQSELTIENSDVPLDIVTATSNEVVNIDNEITSGDMSDTFHNFIQSNIENIDLSIHSSHEPPNEPHNLEIDSNNCDLTHNNNTLKIADTVTEEIEIKLNENNNIVNLKRPAEDITELQTDSKRQKLDENAETITPSTNIETIEISDDPTEINFTQAIFDAEETAANNDPKWSELKDLETNEDYFKSVRTQWRSLSLPNPHKSNTTRYVPKSIANIKPETATSSETEKVLSCEQFLTNRMDNISKDINKLVAKLNHMPRFKSRSERQKIHLELESLRNLKHEVEKNQEEIKHINMFYCNDDQGWNANYLTKSELEELKEQDHVMQFQKKFYKS